MTIERDGAVLRQLRALFGAGTVVGLTDGQLLERFATRPHEAAEAAFGALVERHGPMVLRVCRGVLADPDDAQDAFQATFLILVLKAPGLWVRDSLGPWLHQVAYRTSCCARSDAARRRRHERRAAGMAAACQADDGTGIGDEWEQALHEEIARLPERYRTPMVLCSLEGLTQEQVSQQLRWPVGTVKSRLARGRERLRERLTRRGLVDGVAGTGLLLAVKPAPMPATLMDSTIQAAMQFAVGKATAVGVVAASVVALTERGLKMQFWTRWTFAAGAMMAAGIVAAGAGLLAHRGAVAQQQAAPAGGQPTEDDTAQRRESSKNLRKIALALYNYHDAQNHLPPAAITDRNGKPLLSWRVAILPYLTVKDGKSGPEDGVELYKQFRLDEPYDSPHNTALLAKMPATYAPPDGVKEPYSTYYRAIVSKTRFGSGAAFMEGQTTILDGAKDGMPNTLMVVEAGIPIPWTKPEELTFVHDEPKLPKFGGAFPDGFHALFMDGSVRFILNEIDQNALRVLITRSGQERITAEKVPQRKLPVTPRPKSE